MKFHPLCPKDNSVTGTKTIWAQIKGTHQTTYYETLDSKRDADDDPGDIFDEITYKAGEKYPSSL